MDRHIYLPVLYMKCIEKHRENSPIFEVKSLELSYLDTIYEHLAREKFNSRCCGAGVAVVFTVESMTVFVEQVNGTGQGKNRG